MMEEGHQPDLRALLTQLRGGFEQDAAVIAKLQAIGSERLFLQLRGLFADPDAELRCQAALAVFYVDRHAGIDLLLPLLHDSETVVRWHTCGLLHDMCDPRAVEPLIHVMQTDPDPQVRNTAAYALGGIGDPRAIPALTETMEHDHEFDELGHSASSCAATALDDILHTNHTRVRLSGDLCTMSRTPPDLTVLKSQAMELFRNQ